MINKNNINLFIGIFSNIHINKYVYFLIINFKF